MAGAASVRPPAPQKFWRRMATFGAIVGPGIITANVDNDAGGLTTYSQAGAHFGLSLLWIFLPVAVLLLMVQEMVNRMGVVTGQGLSDMIRERFGVKITFYLMVLVLLTNFGNVMAEFAGIAAASEVLGLPPLVTVPVCALIVWLLVLKGSHKSVEKIFLFACIFYVAYPLTLYILKPDYAELGRALITPSVRFETDYLVMVIGIVGTTIAPWMQFYQQAFVAEKGISIQDYAYSKADTIIGSFIVNLVAACIVAVCAITLHRANVQVDEAADAARSLAPLAGRASSYLFAAGLLNASLFAASILPLSTSYTICEALGWESGVSKDFGDAPQFYVIYTALIACGAAIVLIPGMSFVKVMFWSQVINGLLLPVIVIFILLLVNDRRVMGTFVNGKVYNVVCWAAVGVLTLISLAYVGAMFLG